MDLNSVGNQARYYRHGPIKAGHVIKAGHMIVILIKLGGVTVVCTTDLPKILIILLPPV